MKRHVLLLPAVILVVIVSVLRANTIRVPSQQPTIQAGIDVAVDGDTVLVANDTYTGNGNRDIDFLGKAIVVMSENGPDATVINCELEGRGFYFHSEEDSSSVVRGFTIMLGWGYDEALSNSGGAIFCSNSSPTITSNKIIWNWAESGGGIACGDYSSPSIYDNIIISNIATLGGGGGIACGDDSSPSIYDNIIISNTATLGGGISVHRHSSPKIINNTITENLAEGLASRGGGIHCYQTSHAEIISNIIINNTTNGEGGGIQSNGCTSIILNNKIIGNQAGSGGGIACRLGDLSVIRSNLIYGNRTIPYGMGGGIFIRDNARPKIFKNTIVENSSSQGGGIACRYNCFFSITNTVLWNNRASINGPEICIRKSPDPSVVYISYSNVRWGLDSIYVGEGSFIEWGEGMIDSDPFFVLPEKKDHRLLWESPCIDTGDPTTVFDADGTRSDMGAYYFNQDDYLTLYLTPDKLWTRPGEQFGVTYTAINRWDSPELCRLLSQVLLPGGSALNVLGPSQYTLPANYTVQVPVNHRIPQATPTGVYEYWSQIGLPRGALIDEDSFTFKVIE